MALTVDYNKIFKLADLDKDRRRKPYYFSWYGIPTPLGELFNKKVKEYTSLDVVLSCVNIQYSNMWLYIKVKSDLFGSSRSSYSIAYYDEHSLEKPIGDVSSLIIKAFKESALDFQLPFSDQLCQDVKSVDVNIQNEDQIPDKKECFLCDDGFSIEQRKERVEKYRLSSLVEHSGNFYDRAAFHFTITGLGRHFNNKLNERTNMNVALSSFDTGTPESVCVNLYDASLDENSGIYMHESSCTKTISPLCAQIYGCLRESVEEMKLPPLTSSPEKCHLTIRIISYRKELMRRFILKNVFVLDKKMRNAFPDTSITVREITLPSYDCNVHLRDRAELEFVESKYGKDAVFNAFCKALRECDESEILENDLPKIRIALRSELGPEARDIIGESVFRKL